MFRLCPFGGLPPLNFTFLQLLRLSSTFKTSDAILAILGLRAKDHDAEAAPFIEADYSLDADAILSIFVEKLLTQDTKDPLKFLANAWWPRAWPHTTDKTSWIPQWSESYVSMLAPWSLDDAFSPAKDFKLHRYTCNTPGHLAIGGFQISTVVFCGENMSQSRSDAESVVRFLVSQKSFKTASRGVLALFARTLSAGRDAYGSREKDKAAPVSHFAAFLKRLYQQEPDEEGSDISIPIQSSGPTRRFRDLHSLRKFPIPVIPDPEILDTAAESGDADKFLNAIQPVCYNRRIFLTTGGHLGLGPAEMQPGDVVTVLGGANMPFIIRKDGDYF
jgi:hypothetical protein